MEELIVFNNDEARLNVTWAGQNGDLLDPVPFDANSNDLRAWAEEAIRGGSVAGINPDENVDLSDFVVDRFTANAEVGYNRIFLRPKTPFGHI